MFAGVCSAHELEKYDMVIAQAEGWPTEVDWRVFIERVIDLRDYLQRIIDDVDEDWQPVQRGNSDHRDRRPISLPLAEDAQALADRPRKESVLWKSLMNDIACHGSLHVAGVLGQYENFNTRLPG